MIARALPHAARVAEADARRLRLEVCGVVQGVGFRPFVHRLAHSYNLRGFVRNASAGVTIEVEGAPADLAAFERGLKTHAPPSALVETVRTVALPANGDHDFVIQASETQPDASTLVSPDLALCDDCLRELFDPADRRYRYPFINCTNCGPRYTIIGNLPYDRPATTMAKFALCPACRQEYEDPTDRRFHAQPNACPDCGPRLEFRWLAPDRPTLHNSGMAPQAILREDALLLAQQQIVAGGIVAVKGIGGFHLVCDATNDRTLHRLRQAKCRGDKPFAIMARDLASVLRIAYVNAEEVNLLTSRARPIVLLRQRPNSPLAAAIAPSNPLVGVMLPYTPLHHLLFAPVPGDALEPPPWLVMTSANHAGEPIVFDDDAACAQLGDLADAVLLHNRPILLPCDDSVMRVIDDQPQPIRRARGYAPLPVMLPTPVPPILAVGGEIKNALCVASGDHAFLSQHIGDMQTLETQASFAATAAHLLRLLHIHPTLVACDLHPAYLSTRWAERWVREHPDARLVRIQHHHAHIAALMAEHGLRGDRPVLGICFDGTGYGPDGAIWGGEVLLADYQSYSRVAHLAYLPLPGGDAAIHKPYRMALAALWAAGINWEEDLLCVAAATPGEHALLHQQLAANLNCVPTSSMGRLFDAVSSLCGVRHHATYEAQAAIELEACVRPHEDSYHFAMGAGDATTFDAAPVLAAIVRDLQRGIATPVIASRFHNAVVNLIVETSIAQRSRTGINQIVLTGGVFQNTYLVEQSVRRLRAAGFEPLIHRKVPPNDGGLALGQAIIAAHQEGDPCV